MKKRHLVGLLALYASVCVECPVRADDVALSLSDLNGAYARKNVARISVHDPSIFLDTITSASNISYYMIGSHLGMGRFVVTANGSTMGNMVGVTSVSESSNSFFKNVAGTSVNCDYAYGTHAITKVKNYAGEEVDFGNFDAHGWQYTGFTVKGNQWAPDVVWNPTMQKWLMYMSLNGDKWCSSIVCFTADKPTGPYTYQGPVVFSGFQGTYTHNSYAAADDWKHTDLSIATGATSLPARYNVGSSWGTYWPNCIDPCVFYAEDGRLLMSYGSWSGGIWMIELDQTTGLRDYTVTYPYQVKGVTVAEGSANANCTSDPYFGRKISGGWYVSGEGSYIEHVGDWYYLFVSYGFFSPDGGYEMRIFRSQNPEGPYIDVRGNTAIQYDRYQMNYGTNAANNCGMKIMGGYQWGFMPWAEISQGHNSLLTDKFGRTLLCYHTKFNDGTAGHSVRVHQLFQNEDGWLVAAPYEFHNEKVTQSDITSGETISNDEIPGTYQMLRHTYKVNYADMAYQKPTNIVLKASDDDPYSGTMTGYGTGTWKRTPGTDFFELKFFNVTYKGVLCRQTVDYSNIPALCFTCVSSTGDGTDGGTSQLQIWGSKADAKAAIKCTLDSLVIPVSDGMNLTENVSLPTTGKFGATVAWKSSDTKILTNVGAVRGMGEVTLNLTISKDGYSYSKDYTILVGDYSAITTLEGEKETTQQVFNFYGQRVQQHLRGFCIVNGQKCVIK